MSDSNVAVATSSSDLSTAIKTNAIAAAPLTTQAGGLTNSTSSLTASSSPPKTSAATTTAATTNQNGLRAQYYQGKNFANLKWSEIDPTVNFVWGTNAPNSIVLADRFSVRWTGQVVAKTSEIYTFYTRSDDGIRLWVNGQLLIDNWTDHDVTENSGSIALAAGQATDIKLEYYNNTGGATAQLLWSSPTQAKNIIPASQLFQGVSTLAFATGEPAKSASSFVDSIGVNTHLRYYDTAYGNYSLVKQSLLDLGIHHIRDGGSDPTWIQHINELGSLGIKSTLVIDPNVGIGPDASYDIKAPGYTVANFVKNLVSTGVEAVEILNEFDLFSSLYVYSRNGQPVKGDGWISYLRDFTRDVYTALKADPATAKIPIIGPSFVYSTSSSAVGDLSQWVDYGSFHPYNNPKNPGDGSLEKDYTMRSKPFGTKPMIATEVGYSTGSAKSDRPVTETVQGKYISRLFLESFNQGVSRAFSYELFDQKADPNNSENNYGLIRSDGTPKPAYTALKNLISLLNDPLPATTTAPTATTSLGALNYSIGGNTQNLHHTLLEKSNGDFYLVLWLEVPSTDQTVSQTVTLNFNTALGGATAYAPNQSTTPVATFANPTQLTLGVTDAPMVIKLSAASTAVKPV